LRRFAREIMPAMSGQPQAGGCAAALAAT